MIYILSGFKWFFFWVTLPAILLAKFQNKKVILSGRGGAAEDFLKKWKYIVKPIFKLIDRVTVPSQFLRDVFKNVLDYETTIIPNIADLELFKYRERKRFNPKLIVTRRLEKIYNIACIIRAFQIIQQRYHNAELAIVGDGRRIGLRSLDVWPPRQATRNDRMG